MSNWLGILALCVPALHALLMGMIGYPLAMQRRGGLQRFRRSGFTWWLISLVTVLLCVLTSVPGQLSPGNPATADLGTSRVVITAALALVGCLAVETVGAAVLRYATRATSDRGSRRYNEALPAWAALPGAELMLLAVTAVLEEAVYRGTALTWLVADSGLPSTLAVGISAVAFGAAHWYYGVRQIVLKILVGVVLSVAALSAGWIAAAAAHVALNSLLVLVAAGANKRAYT